MGAAVGVESAGVPEDILQQFKACEALQQQIAESDMKFLKSQGRQMWKNHKKIIATICSKTKNQLSRMASMNGGSKVSLSAQLEDMLGGEYGEFVRSLVLTRAEINAEAMRGALDCIGCDEETLVRFLCVCSTNETATLLEKYNEAAAMDLASKIDGKVEKNTPLAKFLKSLMAAGSKRDVDSVTDLDTAGRQMDDIREICGEATPEREKELFELLCCLSRAQCALINTQLVEKHNINLDALFKRRFKGSICKALSLWTSSIDDAICHTIYDILHDPKEEYGRLGSILSKYDKLQLLTIRDQYEVLFKESLVSRVEEATVGNHKLSLVAWLSLGAFDAMNEERIVSIITSHGSLSCAVADVTSLQKIRDTLAAEQTALDSYNSHLCDKTDVGPIPEHMTLPPIGSMKMPDPAPGKTAAPVAASSAMSGDVEGVSEDKPSPVTMPEDKEEGKEDVTPTDPTPQQKGGADAVPPIAIITDEIESKKIEGGGAESPTKIAPLNTHNKKAVSIRGIAMDFDVKYKAVSSFLREEFAIFDADKSGYLESAEFWNALRAFKLGYTEDEIGAMIEWTDWDCDGHISLSEVINELAESVITMIEGRGEELLSGLAIIKARLKTENEELQRMESSSGLSIDLVGYLKDSFEAYDTDQNGGLGTDEFWRVIQVVLCETVNGLKEIEIEEMRSKWDSNQDGWITWKEALTQFIEILKGMVSDKRDHWIGLVDKPSGNLFWYNLRDESSCWMSEEDQVAYKADEKVNKKISVKY